MMQLGEAAHKQQSRTQDGSEEIKQKYLEIFCIFQSERKSYALTSQHQLPESILTVMEAGSFSTPSQEAVSPDKTQPILYLMITPGYGEERRMVALAIVFRATTDAFHQSSIHFDPYWNEKRYV